MSQGRSSTRKKDRPGGRTQGLIQGPHGDASGPQVREVDALSAMDATIHNCVDDLIAALACLIRTQRRSTIRLVVRVILV